MKKSESPKSSDPKKLAAQDNEKEFLIAGIGASAGGIKALKEFFRYVPPDSGIAYVVILHLSPEFESKLAEVLQTTAQISVEQIGDEPVKVKPDCVYVIPPNKSLLMEDDFLKASAIKSHAERRAPVDIFFRTLAESHGSRAVSVILSGTGPNGSMGVKRVKEKGGVIFVQDPNEAEFSDMPRNTIATNLADAVLPVAQIPAKIISYRDKLGNASEMPAAQMIGEEPDAQALRDVLTNLRVRTGHDFANYKRATVMRRIERRMNVRELASLPEYAAFLRENAEETSALLKDLLISVTNFFRDGEAFSALQNDIIPKLLEGKTSNDTIRLWIAGCATGEEAYSLAMLFSEYTEAKPDAPKVQIFATDIDETAIAAARDGMYSNSDAADISPERLRRFFTTDGECYRVRRELRQMISFANHNILRDPPFSHLDIVSCRNLLIYFNRTAQTKVMEIFHFALNPGSYLFLGSSESIESGGDLFVPVDKKKHIYKSRAVRARIHMPVIENSAAVRFDLPRPLSSRSEETNLPDRLSSSALHLNLLEHYAPPSIVVNEEYDIVHTSKNASRFTQLSGGEPSINLLKVVRPELRLELRTALYQAIRNRVSIETRELSVKIDDRTEKVKLVVRPVPADDESGARGFLLVIFKNADKAEISENDPPVEAFVSAEPIARKLEEELMQTKALLRSTIEQYEVRTEELKASNEELQAMNEETHSVAEELETSKEELESINEELKTVNQELKIKIEELSLSNNDFQNLMNSTSIGTMFLDRNLRIKMFTPTIQSIFNLIPNDLGRRLTDITGRIDYANLISDAESVIKNLQPVEREVKTDDGRWFLTRIAPYRTSEDRISGVIFTFVDISRRRTTEANLRESEESLRLLIESATDFAIFTVSPENFIDSWNTGAERVFGYQENEILGKSAELLFTAKDRKDNVPEKEIATARETGHAEDERWHLRKDGSRFFASGVMTPLKDSRGFLKIARDVTERIKAEQFRRDKEMLQKLVTAQEDERKRIARDLHDQLGQQMTALRLKLETTGKLCNDNEELCAKIDEIQSIAENIDADVDFLAWELRPAALDDLGLVVSLRRYIQEWTQHSGVKAEFHASGLENTRLIPEAETNLYRITQEAFNNIWKHAAATRASLLLEKQKNSVVLIIEDNGIGFDINEKHNRNKGIGLIGMQERAALIGGTLEIETSQDQGTTVFVRVPALVNKGDAENE